MVAAILVCALACHRATIPAGTQLSNAKTLNQSGQTILVGPASLSILQRIDNKSWYDNAYQNYSVDLSKAQELKPRLERKRMKIFLGSWCGDSKRELPRMLKVLELAGMDTADVSLIFVDYSIKNYKQSPGQEEKNKNIHHVPSFIVYNGKKELGRIIKTPVVSLEKDLLSILQQTGYQPKYLAIDYWIKKISSRMNHMTDLELQNLVSVIKPMCKHSGELNAYGYVLLPAKKQEESLNIFRLNTMIYPESAKVFDSLGEAWKTIGNKSDAIVAYQKVLSLQPNDANAKNRIAALMK